MKRKKIVLLISLILVVALCVGLFVGCNKTGKTVISSGKTDGGKISTIDGGVDCLQSFAVQTVKDLITAEFEKYFTVVEYVTGTTVKVNVAKRGVGSFVINAPTEGYTLGQSYKISLRSGARFKNYPKAVGVAFTVTTNYLSKSTLNAGVMEYDEHLVVTQESSVTGKEVKDGYKCDVMIDDYGVESGNFQINTKGNLTFKAGDVFILNDKNKLKKEAFKVASVTSLGGDIVEINYVKPDMDEIYNDFQYADDGKTIDDANGNIEITYDENGERNLNNSELASSIISIFGEKPTFNLSPSIVKDAEGNTIVRVVVTITVPGVVRVQGASLNLSIVIQNDLKVTSKTIVNLAQVAQDIKDANFNLKTNIKNDTSCKVVIDVSGGFDIIQNAQELLEKLTALSNGQNGSVGAPMTDDDVKDATTGDKVPGNDGAQASVCVPIFRWTLPLAAGALGISYNADLAFRFSFSGQFEIEVKGSIEYDVNVSYTKADGVQITSKNVKETDKFLDSVDITLKGVATVKIGLVQRLGLNILAGVLNIEVQAEIGNYNRLYGFAKTNNLLKKDLDIVGAVYFEGGFYYDIDLILAVRIGVINIADTKIDITGGEIRMYEAGNQNLELAVNDINTFETKSFETVLPDYTVAVYNLVSGGVTNQVIDRSKLTYTIVNGAENVTVDKDGVLVVDKELRTSQVNCTVSVQYTNDKGHIFPAIKTDVTYDGTALSLDKQDRTFDKASRESLLVSIAMKDGMVAPSIIDSKNNVIASSYDAKTKTLKIDNVDASCLPTGVNKLFVVSTYEGIEVKAPLNITTLGKVTLDKDRVDNTYYVYTPDQIVELTTYTAEQTKDKVFNISRDINMLGMCINPIAEFNGILDGRNFTIRNYTVNSMVGNNAGLVAVNNGTISNLKLVGNVDVTVPSGYNQTYNIGGVVGVNNGSLNNITLGGSKVTLDGYNELTFGIVNVYNKSLNTNVKYNIGGIAGVEGQDSSIINCNTTASVAEVKDEQGNVIIPAVVGNVVKFKAMLYILGIEVNIGGKTSKIGGNAPIEISGAGSIIFIKVNKA